MKKILISMVAAGAIVSSLSAIEVYKDGDNSVNVFGTVRGVAGYGYAFQSIDSHSNFSNTNDILFGLQGNSRIGLDFKYNGFFGAALVGLNEKTLLTSPAGTPGLRQLYAGYDFGKGGKILVGKVETLTSMSFSSDIFDTDNGLNGFGGTSTSTRRIQVQYTLPVGLSVAISENDMNANTPYSKNFLKSTPRVSLAYDYNSKDLAARIAATYAYGNSYTTTTTTTGTSGTTSTTTNYGVKNAFLITGGIKPTFGKAYFSGMLTYGLNSDMIGESRVAWPSVTHGLNNVGITTAFSRPGSSYYNHDLNIYAAMAEFGYSVTDSLKTIIGLGYQFSSLFDGSYEKLHSYSAFFQLPYAVSKNFSIIPQVGYLGNTQKVSNGYNNAGGIYAIAQARFTF